MISFRNFFSVGKQIIKRSYSTENKYLTKHIPNNFNKLLSLINEPSLESFLKNAPHSEKMLYNDWKQNYTKAQAFHPLPFVKRNKYNIPVSRVDDAHGDRNLIIIDE